MKFTRVFSLLLLCALTGLTACNRNENARRLSPAVMNSTARSYALNLSMAELTLDRQPENLKTATPYVNKMNGSTKALNHKQSSLSAVLLEYETKDTGQRRVAIAPVAQGKNGNYDFSALSQVTNAIAARNPEYRAIRGRTLTVSSPTALTLKRSTLAGDVKSKLDDAHDDLLSSAQSISKLENAQLQLALTRFFLEKHIKDAAYLSLENAKQLLADADASNADEAARVKTLSMQLSPLENTLHQKMPYDF